jgi:hypothetical protein
MKDDQLPLSVNPEQPVAFRRGRVDFGILGATEGWEEEGGCSLGPSRAVLLIIQITVHLQIHLQNALDMRQGL